MTTTQQALDALASDSRRTVLVVIDREPEPVVAVVRRGADGVLYALGGFEFEVFYEHAGDSRIVRGVSVRGLAAVGRAEVPE